MVSGQYGRKGKAHAQSCPPIAMLFIQYLFSMLIITDNFNIVYVLYCANKLAPNYRFDDIEKFLMNRLNLYKEYYHPEYGGFSFYKNQSNNVLYGKKLAESKNEPDIHGTIMFTWGLALIDKMIGLNLDFKVPLN